MRIMSPLGAAEAGVTEGRLRSDERWWGGDGNLRARKSYHYVRGDNHDGWNHRNGHDDATHQSRLFQLGVFFGWGRHDHGGSEAN